ncbi:MAG: aldo/keto reductase [Pseudomonadota bacterium]|jgi:Aldo/keto reductases, related to diketogulonate reductase
MSPNSRLSVCDGASIPVIGFGTWPLKDEECARAVAAALACGYRHIDTAEMYANEEAVGQGLRASGVPRDEVWITTKVWWENISDGALQRSAEASLKRLGVDQVDLLLIHWPNKQVPLAESIRALNDAKKRGFARHIGVSNFPSRMLEEALALSEAPLIANQCEYHPYLDQSKVRAVCERNNMAFVSYCPLGRGSVGGVLEDPVVREIANRLGRTPAQVVLRWHLQQPNVIPLPKSGNPKRIAENFDVFGFSLNDEDMARLSSLARPDGRVVNLAFAPEWD